MKKYNFIENDMNNGGNGGFKSALKSGCDFVSRNKGKFIGGGVLLTMAEESWRKWDVIKAGMGSYAAEGEKVWKSFTATEGAGMMTNLWGRLKNFYDNLFRAVGGAGGAVSGTTNSWFSKVQEFFSGVFTKDGFKFFGKSGGHYTMYAVLAVVIVLLVWVVWKIVKKIRSRKATTESYVSLLSDQSFLEAKQVAYYLKENTAMSKKDCNRIANFVYKKSLNRKLNNLI